MTDHTERTPAKRTRAPAWQSIPLIVACVITLVGVGLWVYAASTRSAAPDPTPPRPTAQGMVQGLAPTDADTAAPAAPRERLIDRAAPAVARLGGGFIIGFCIAYAFKKAIKIAALTTGVILIAMIALHMGGIIDLDWAALSDRIDKSVAWVIGRAGSMSDFFLGFLPSTASAIAGMVTGFRRG